MVAPTPYTLRFHVISIFRAPVSRRSFGSWRRDRVANLPKQRLGWWSPVRVEEREARAQLGLSLQTTPFPLDEHGSISPICVGLGSEGHGPLEESTGRLKASLAQPCPRVGNVSRD